MKDAYEQYRWRDEGRCREMVGASLEIVALGFRKMVVALPPMERGEIVDRTVEDRAVGATAQQSGMMLKRQMSIPSKGC